MIEQEIPKTLNVKDPGGRRQWSTHPSERPWDAGENGGPNGDLWLVIHIAPHPLFDIVGRIWKLWCRLARGKRRWVLKSPFQH